MPVPAHHIRSELGRIEREQGVRVLYAVDSGSHAWGFPSRDSRHEVRFLFARGCGPDLAGDDRRDVIGESGSGRLDIAGWDLRKTLPALRESSPALLEWIKSPVVYRADPAFALWLGLLASEFYSAGRCFRHYLDLARDHRRELSRDEPLRLETYLAVLRPLLACRWIEQGRGPAPMKFPVLADAVLADANLRFHVAVLVARKRAGGEGDVVQRIPIIEDFIAGEFPRLEKIAPAETAVPAADKLNQFFLREFCAEAA